jgi:uncharacterized damage-inducible protein DinB
MKGEALLPEFDQEMANTRKMLERLPEDRMDFQPHEKSFDLLDLAGHISNIPTWTGVTLSTEELDFAQPFERTPPETKEAVLAEFDSTVAEARAALEGASAEDMAVTWTLRDGDRVYFSMPRLAVIRSFVMNHLIHHRAQLGLYLRLLDVPIPGMYGPSADEGM